MTDTKGLPLRSEVPIQETWDLSALFPTLEAYEAALDKVKSQGANFAAKWQGKIADAKAADLVTMLNEYEELYDLLIKVGTYSSLETSADMTDAAAQTREMNASAAFSRMQADLTFMSNDLMELDESVLDAIADLEAEYKMFVSDLKIQKQHRLEPETERVLAALGQTLNTPYTGYSITKLADMSFDDFEVDGKSYPNSYVLFENHYGRNTDTGIRRGAFDSFSRGLERYINTTANYYNSQIQKEKTMATLRGYDSVIDYLLEGHKIPRELYDRQIDVIMEELAPHMRRYAGLLKEQYGLDEIRYADLKLELDPDFSPDITIEESQPYMEGALSILGDEYLELVKRNYSERWTDFANNKGKSTGGFCATPYNSHSFILLSWNGKMSELFTLAHELGHAGHFMLSGLRRKPLNWDPSMYFVEAPSTCNEMLLGNYLLEQNKNERFQSWVRASLVTNTYYHNFVTHLLEAAYQREVYRLVDEGQNLQAADFSRIFREQLTKFWGDTVVLDEGAELTWMRQPHYYMGLYSYTYSAGLTISTVAGKRILNEGQAAVDDWLEALYAGGSVTPVEFANLAGVDITTDRALKEAVAYIGELIDGINIYK